MYGGKRKSGKGVENKLHNAINRKEKFENLFVTREEKRHLKIYRGEVKPKSQKEIEAAFDTIAVKSEFWAFGRVLEQMHDCDNAFELAAVLPYVLTKKTAPKEEKDGDPLPWED